MHKNHAITVFLTCLSNTDSHVDEDTTDACRVDGGYMFVSSLFSAQLAFGVDPIKAMGYAGALPCL